MVELVKQNFRKNKKLFLLVYQKLQNCLGENIPIDHVGSTAIPNMVGKNIIDILIGAKDTNEFQHIEKIIQEEGFFPNAKKEDIYQFFASKTTETSSGDIHIHLAIIHTERYQEFLILKQYLLSNKQEAKAYSNHKKELIQKGITVRKQYKQEKSEYVTKLIERAKNSIKTVQK